MSGTSWIVAEVFVGIVLLMIVGGLLGVFVPRMLGESPSSPDEILNRRYARGELTREQYLQMRQDLGIPAGAGVARQTREPAATD
ncbi:MAG TPA: SHOCT domain-containing protein [Thermomicrobiaceae bacterium]|nr:SHOCT domain-containing protein [Thermomicrobiaceae bacterium]